MPRSRARALLPLLLATSAISGRAAANVGYAPRAPSDPTALAGGVLRDATTLRVESEDLTIDCVEAAGELRCRFQGAYHLQNPTDERQEIVGAFYSPKPSVVSFTLGGKPLGGTPTPEEMRALDERMSSLDHLMANLLRPPGRPDAGDDIALNRSGFRATLEPNERTDLAFAGDLPPREIANLPDFTGYLLPPVRTRHPLWGGIPMSDHTVTFEYLVAPLRTWAGAPRVHLTIRHPSRWKLDPGWSLDVSEHTSDSVTTEVTELDPRMTGALKMKFRRARPILNGGPLAAIGGRLGTRDFRLRAGYEVGLTPSVIGSFAIEHSDTGKWTFVPVVDAGSPFVMVIPSLSAGLGLPVQLQRGASPRVGVRAQLAVSFPAVSLVVPFDLLPGRDDAFQAAMYFQVSL